MRNKENELQSTVQGTDEARTTHETGYQVINGVAITPELIKQVGFIQYDLNDALKVWESKAMRLINAFMTYSDGNLEDSERLEHVWTICNLVEFVAAMESPLEFQLQQIEEERREK
mgnify:CR=1 FL=1